MLKGNCRLAKSDTFSLQLELSLLFLKASDGDLTLDFLSLRFTPLQLLEQGGSLLPHPVLFLLNLLELYPCKLVFDLVILVYLLDLFISIGFLR